MSGIPTFTPETTGEHMPASPERLPVADNELESRRAILQGIPSQPATAIEFIIDVHMEAISHGAETSDDTEDKSISLKRDLYFSGQMLETLVHHHNGNSQRILSDSVLNRLNSGIDESERASLAVVAYIIKSELDEIEDKYTPEV